MNGIIFTHYKGEQMKKTIEEQLQAIEKHLQEECSKCDGTGKPKTKTGEPAKTGKNVKCKECFGTGIAGYKIDILLRSIGNIKKDIGRITEDLKAHMNRQTAEIRVLPKGHNPSLQGGNSKVLWEKGWEDYTGVFYIDSIDEKEIVLGKAKKHFKKYFENSAYHRNKKLGVFLTSGRSGKHLIEEMKTD
tara:strand:- start:59 stop:625 length:567 start_codon:yes stop_codon:yes gene_type:complete